MFIFSSILFLCDHVLAHPFCAILNVKPQNTGRLLFMISILEVRDKIIGQVHTFLKMSPSVFLPLSEPFTARLLNELAACRRYYS